jgi:uncharacterized protein YodC (DUF2158 family)
MDFKVGDVVRLRSGGPDMTIVGFAKSFPEEHSVAECRWFENGEKKAGNFPPEALEKVQDE